MMFLGLVFTFVVNFPSERFNITFSAFLGALIITVRQQIKDYRYEKKLNRLSLFLAVQVPSEEK